MRAQAISGSGIAGARYDSARALCVFVVTVGWVVLWNASSYLTIGGKTLQAGELNASCLIGADVIDMRFVGVQPDPDDALVGLLWQRWRCFACCTK